MNIVKKESKPKCPPQVKRNGKGHSVRPYDADKYSTNFDQINWSKPSTKKKNNQ